MPSAQDLRNEIEPLVQLWNGGKAARKQLLQDLHNYKLSTVLYFGAHLSQNTIGGLMNLVNMLRYTEMNQPQKDALHFFWCDQEDDRLFWGGYARFFSPALPDRIGTVLLQHIQKAIHQRDAQAVQKVIEILSQPHVKNVHDEKGHLIGKANCQPTPDALKAIEFLKGIIS